VGRIINVAEGGRLPNFISELDSKTGKKTRNLIVIPILVDGVVRGSILATNRVSSGEELFGPKSSSLVSKEKGLLPPFGPEDEILLGFIAANAGLAIKYSMMQSMGSPGGGFSSSRRMSKLNIPPPDVDSTMQQLVDAACADLDADLISVFAYNDSTKRLECTVSKDIKGLSIPIDKGIAGTAFRMGRVINVKEIASDDRHNHDVDAQVGYKTQTLLCAPIMDSSGRPVGVMQALNKKGTSHFTRQDEAMICDLCVKVCMLLQDADYLRDCSDNCDAVLVSRFLSTLSLAATMAELSAESRRLVAAAVACDFVGLYTYVEGDSTLGDHLLSEDPTVASSMESAYGNRGRILMKDIPSQIVEALRSGLATELSVSKANKLSCKLSNKNAHENFLPGISARHAIIMPINAKLATSTYALCPDDGDDTHEKVMASSMVLVVIKSSQSLLPFSAAAREILDLFVAVLGPSVKNLLQCGAQEAAVSALESNFALANSTLGTITDYILLLNSAGRVVTSNRDLSTLVGPDTSQRIETIGGVCGQGQGLERHFSTWFRPSECAALVADIGQAVRTIGSNAVSISNTSVLTTSEHREGLAIEYQLLSIDVAGVQDEEEARLMLVIHPMNKEFIQTLKRDVPLRSGGHTSTSEGTAKVSDKAPALAHNRAGSETAESAREIVDAANELLRSVRDNCTVPLHVKKSLDDVTKILENVSPKLMTCSEKVTCEDSLKDRIVCLVDPNIVPPADLFTWEFDVLRIKDKNCLVNALGLVFQSLNLLDTLGIDPNTLANYISDVSVKYHDKNPFHNLHHATYVTQFAYMLIHATNADKYLSPKQLFGVILSAVVHDVDHPGNTNMFEINSQSPLALLYNDQSVLENHHCSTAFQLMRKPTSNIFAHLDKTVALELRKIIVSCVMATDMSVHFELVEETKKIVASGDSSFTDLQDQMFLCKLLVHSADLSNPVRPFHITQAWARRISAEFNLQIAMEQELDLPVLNFMITPDDKALCKNETGFASFVVAPMWRSLSGLFPGLLPLVRQLDSNLLSWKAILEKIMKEEGAERSASGKH
jgi:GAF domain-containing protein